MKRRTTLALALLIVTTAAFAQKGLTGKVVKIDAPALTITLAAVMGYKDMRVRSKELLDKIKVDDVIQFVTAQEGNGLVITEIEVIKLPQ